MKALIKIILVFALALSGANASAQCTLSGYAICNGADQNEYYIIIDISKAQLNDVVAIQDDQRRIIEGSSTIAFGPFDHSGTGLVHQDVLLNNVFCIEILETICGYRTTNGLHASGAGCLNEEDQSTGFILAQSQPGTFQNNHESRQLYVLSDHNDDYVDVNSTGLFKELSNDYYRVRAINVRTSEATSFVSGLSSTTDLENYIITGCTSVCGAVQYSPSCSNTGITAKVDPIFTDPCDCLNPLNHYAEDGSLIYIHDLLEVSLADPDDNWVIRNPGSTFYYQSSPGVFEEVTDGTALKYIGNNAFQIEIYHSPNIGWSANLESINGPNTGFFIPKKGNICDCPPTGIPTLSQWGIFILGLLLSSLACIMLIIHQRKPYG